jgi:hypothetical protein
MMTTIQTGNRVHIFSKYFFGRQVSPIQLLPTPSIRHAPRDPVAAMLRLSRERPKEVKKIIQRKIEEARLRSRLNVKPYVIEPTGRGRIKCHADMPDLSCARCRRRLLMRRRRAEDAVARAASLLDQNSGGGQQIAA